jgi:Type I phosphodiesterase / nucleotide pyrophosphatase
MEPAVPVTDPAGPTDPVAAIDPVTVDFARSVAAIVPALLGFEDAMWLPSAVHGARSVVLLVVDGLGWRAFDDAPAALANLREFDGFAITTVLPATTASALTSITTGTAPGTHGLFGFRMRYDDVILNNLRWQTDPRRAPAPDPEWVQRRPPFRGARVPVVAKAEHEGSGFSLAHLRGSEFVGWRQPNDIVEHCSRLVSQGAPFVYAYYPGVDEVAHEFGLRDGAYAQELAFADGLIARLRAALPTDAALVVTADHGQIHLEPDAWVELGTELLGLVAEQAGDARCRFLYARNGAAGELVAGCRERFADIAWVATRRELLDAGAFGPLAPGSVAGRIGDVVLMPRTDVGFVDPGLLRETGLRSAHGAPTAAEMEVPLLAARGERPG